jgi:tight adherence protein C
VATVIGAALAPSLLHQELRAERERRFREVARSLPVEIDLAAMCMHAGLDFPGAIRLMIEAPHRGQRVLHEELLRILQELDLGHTRAEALRSFAERVPSPAVREFVAAAIQAEAKGTPLSEVLRIQATMLRMQRTVQAEEAAARAGILMALPLIMLLCSLLIMLLGALIIKSFESEIWS